jgi:hypothetical protein
MTPPYPDRRERRFREGDFPRGCRVKGVSQRNTAAVDHHHPLRPFAPLGFSDSAAPFFARAKLPSRNDSLHFNCWRWFNSLRNVRQLKSSSTGRQIVEDDAARHEGILTSGLFLYAPPHGDFQSKLSRVTYPRRNFFEAKYGDIPTSYLALGEPNAVRIVLEYVSLQSDRAKEEAEEWNQQQQSLKGDKEALRAKRLVELAIKHDQSGEIGGEIDVAILRKNGTVEWAANPNCK